MNELSLLKSDLHQLTIDSAAHRASLADGAAQPALGPGLSGVGLWLSARIAEQQGGRLEVDEAQAAGTSIRVRLPASA